MNPTTPEDSRRSNELNRPFKKEIAFSEDEDEEIGHRGNDSNDEDEDEIDGPEAADLLQNEKAIKSGYLLKKGERRRRSWKKRWFVLRASKIAYYKDDKEYKLLRFIDLQDVHTVTDVKLKNKQNVFTIVTPGRIYYVQTDSKRLLDEWISAINQARRDLRESPDEDDSSAAQDEVVAKEIVSNYAHNEAARRPSAPGLSARPQRQSVRITTANAPKIPGQELASPKSPTAAALSSSVPSAPPPSSITTIPTTTTTTTQPVSILKNSLATSPPQQQPQPQLQPQTTIINTAVSTYSPPTSESHVTSAAINIPRAGGHQSSPEAFPSHSYTSISTSASAASPSSPLSPIVESGGFLSSEGAASSEDDEWDPADMPTEVLNAERIVEAEGGKSRVLFQGYLVKLGRNKSLPSWKRRWFVLRSDSLSYYKNEKEYAAHKVIPLAKIVDSLEIEPASRSKLHCFKIVIPKRSYILSADTLSDLEGWLNALSVAVRRAKKSEHEDGSFADKNEDDETRSEALVAAGQETATIAGTDETPRGDSGLGPAVVRSQA